MKNRITIISLTAVLFLFSIVCQATAFDVYKTSGGKTVKWQTPSVGYYINTAGSPVAASDAIAAITSALQTWTAVNTSSFEFQYLGTAAYVSGNNKINTLGFRKMGKNGTLAYNTFWYSSSTGYVSDSDIEFNTDYLYATNGSSTAFDMQNIATHELGHSLPLRDLYTSSDAEKTMYGYARAGETKKRSLEQDDINGIAHLYPANATVCSYTISPSSQSFGANGGTGSIAVTAPSGCNWTIVNNLQWVSITGNQNGTVTYSVAQNTGTGSRLGTMTVAGRTFTVIQDGTSNNTSSINITLDKTSLNFGQVTAFSTVSQTVSVTNNGTGAVTVALTVSGSNANEFSAALSTNTISPGMSTSITVRFSPISTGIKSATLTVTPNNSAVAQKSVSLSGSGITSSRR